MASDALAVLSAPRTTLAAALASPPAPARVRGVFALYAVTLSAAAATTYTGAITLGHLLASALPWVSALALLTALAVASLRFGGARAPAHALAYVYLLTWAPHVLVWLGGVAVMTVMPAPGLHLRPLGLAVAFAGAFAAAWSLWLMGALVRHAAPRPWRVLLLHYGVEALLAIGYFENIDFLWNYLLVRKI